MKAKFIKHNNPRGTLDIGILAKKIFKTNEEYIDWLYKYVVPDFYGMENGPDLWNKIKNYIKIHWGNMPDPLVDYISKKIEPYIKITQEEKNLHWPILLRKKYPFSSWNDEL